MKPARQRIAGHCLRSPSVTSVAGLATTILASSSAMIPRKSPTPAEIANLRFLGIELMMYSRILNTEMRKNSTPEQNTPASAATLVTLGDLKQWPAILCLAGFIVIVALNYRNIIGATLIG